MTDIPASIRYLKRNIPEITLYGFGFVGIVAIMHFLIA